MKFTTLSLKFTCFFSKKEKNFNFSEDMLQEQRNIKEEKVMIFFRSLIAMKARRTLLVFFGLSYVITLLIIIYILYQYVFPQLHSDQIFDIRSTLTYGLLTTILISLLGFFLMSRLIGSLEALTKEIIEKSEQMFEEKKGFKEESEIDALKNNFDKLYNELHEKMQTVTEYSEKLFDTNTKLSELVITDELTGLFNRRHFNHRLLEEINRAERYKNKLSLIMIDVDNFKDYNDIYGHLLGDKVLQSLGELIKKTIRRSDISFRYGGDEFAIILPDCDSPFAEDVARKIFSTIANHSFENLGDSFSGNVTISCGVTSYAGDLEDFVKKADRLMYEAKKAGKGTVIGSSKSLNITQ